MKILLVDDTKTERMIMASYLKKMGHEVIISENGEQAIELFKQNTPDLILLDVIMPVMDGHNTAKKIRSIGDEWIPIIFLSAKAKAEDVAAGIEAGGDDYLTKPVNQTILTAKMNAMQRIALMRQRLIDVTLQLDKVNRKLSRLVNIDGLTGIANRRYLDHYLESELKRLQRSKQPLTVIMADIDHFKVYNDHFGHTAGDECLKAIASTLQNNLDRPADLAARYGGEEFCIILPETDLAGGAHIAERLRIKVEELCIDHAPTVDRKMVTMSLGVAQCSSQKPRLAIELIHEADKAMYQAKQAGRNMVKTAKE